MAKFFDAYFQAVSFSSLVDFEEAKFRSEVDFNDVFFLNTIYFNRSVFKKNVRFTRAKIHFKWPTSISFLGAKFKQTALFNNISFGQGHPDKDKAVLPCDFRQAEFKVSPLVECFPSDLIAFKSGNRKP